MPHLIIEYSANLEDRFEIMQLVDAVHEAALATGLFPIGGTRTRALALDKYRIADGHPDNGFVHLTVLIGSGRTSAAKATAGRHIFDALTDALESPMGTVPLAVSMYMEETDPELSFKKNNLHDFVAQRSKRAV